MRRKNSWLLLLGPLALALLVVVLDQWSKAAVMQYFANPHGILSVAPFFNLVLVMNHGVSFGLFNGSFAISGLFALLALAVAVGLMLWLPRVQTALGAVAFGLLMGGALGNAIDRLRLGAVVDFLDFHIGHLHWPSFNVADSAVVTGVALLLLQSLVFDKKTGHHS
ncbi:MAG TPA: signal peptidase II [Alphaproteobacteria bacterium]|nr:signal peptidase II [Alphaproteobacteria bacterium]